VAPEPTPGQHTNPASRRHPQFGLSSLLKRLKLAREDVALLDTSGADLDRRAEILSRALAPAEATSDWGAWKSDLPGGALSSAFADVSLIEAANER
ncbi:hypothetical protein ACC702_38175, partial [Rhizobium ruizarguesonis]